MSKLMMSKVTKGTICKDVYELKSTEKAYPP